MQIARYIFGSQPWPVVNEPYIEKLLRRDQLIAIRETVLVALRVNVLLGLTVLLVAWHSDRLLAGIIWFSISCAANLWRVILLYRLPDSGNVADMPIDSTLRWAEISAFLSGLIWSTMPILSDGYTTPDTLFHLVIICGITAGAVTHGTAYSGVPTSFIIPPMASMFGCLVYQGGFDRICLAATVVLYTLMLARSARQTEIVFREASRLKHRATSTARFLEDAYTRSCEVAADMHEWAMHDELTGLLNRRGLIERARGLEDREEATCLMLFDLDGFKAVNDGYGHQAGDRLLREVGRRIRETVPETALVARLGSDEFAVLLGLDADDPDAGDDAAFVENIACRLLAAIAQPFELLGAGRVGCSIGIHMARSLSFADMLSCADEALYIAKGRGRGQFHIFDEELRRRFDMRRNIERELAQAIEDQALDIWFQPIVDGQKHHVISVEALLRWNHPVYGMIPAPEIVSEAAKSGCSDRLLHFVLDRACDAIARLHHQGMGHISVAINISPREIAQLPIDSIILSALENKGVPYSALEIEVTEETVLDVPVVQEKIFALAEKGVRIAIDDFGVGYSSLALLKILRVDRVKVDRCFVTGIDGAKDNRALLRAVMMLGHAIGFDIVAEGVETQSDMTALQLLGCRAMQGYFFYRPMTVNELMAMLGGQGGSADDDIAAALI